MTAKVIKLPGLPAGLTLTCEVRSSADGSLLEVVALTGAGSLYTGTITGAHYGLLVFSILVSGVAGETRVRTIDDTAGPWVIVTGLDQVTPAPTGAFTRTFIITNGTSPLEGANVRVKKGAEEYVRTTGPSGTFNLPLDAGTYTIGVTCIGYDPVPATLVVSAAGSTTYALTAVVITPSAAPGTSTGFMTVFNESMQPEAGKLIKLQMTVGTGVAGKGLDREIREATSAAVTGLVEFPNLYQGATYEIWRGDIPAVGTGVSFALRGSITKKSFVVPITPTFALPEILGEDAA
jgi:hypothetical protein